MHTSFNIVGGMKVVGGIRGTWSLLVHQSLTNLSKPNVEIFKPNEA